MDAQSRQAMRTIERLVPEQQLLIGVELVKQWSFNRAEHFWKGEEPKERYSPRWSRARNLELDQFVIWARVWVTMLAARELLVAGTDDVMASPTLREAAREALRNLRVGTSAYMNRAIDDLREAIWG